jgi:hypothetical protein
VFGREQELQTSAIADTKIEMTRARTFTIAAVAFLCSAMATLLPVTFESPCECRDNHGKHRRSVKDDPSTLPADASAIQAVTPSDIFSWRGPDVRLTQQSERTGIENKWFALTGRVVALEAETDGDLHIELQDATGDKPGIVIVEVPAKPQWCEIRTKVFSWTQTRFPFHTRSAKKLTLTQAPVITVTGKAFFDVGHSIKDQKSNRRSHLPGYAGWEIHPVMKLERRFDVQP